MLARFVWLLGLLVLGCSDLAAPGFSEPPELEFWPARDGLALRVVRVRVRSDAAAPLEPSALRLFSGELSEYHAARLQRGELATTLAERIVPALVLPDAEAGVLTLAPSVVLEAGTTYSLAAPGHGRLGAFSVSATDTTPLLERLWPPHGAPGNELIALCAAITEQTLATLIAAEPGSFAFGSALGQLADGRRCVGAPSTELPKEVGPRVLPAEARGFLLDPAPLDPAAATPPTPLPCLPGEVSIGPACALVLDDRLALAPMPESLLWRWLEPDGPRLEAIAAGRGFSLRGFEPESERRLSGSVVSASGFESPFDVVVLPPPRRAHVVLNEVLANPLGPEPAAEWVEIVNDSEQSVDLTGWSFGDAGGTASLPSARLEAFASALLVREDFAVGAGDVPVDPSVELVRLPMLGAKGLGNAGEALFLWDAAGELVSEFPALPATRAGVSLARIRLDAVANDPLGFAPHGAPGASPGSANSF